MAKITQERVQKINQICCNEWIFDTRYYLFHSENRLIKNIELDEENYLEFALGFNYDNQITLHISKYHHKKDEAFATSRGLGKSKMIDETKYKRKNINRLIEYTPHLGNEKLLEINKNTPISKGYGVIVASEEF